MGTSPIDYSQFLGNPAPPVPTGYSNPGSTYNAAYSGDPGTMADQDRSYAQAIGANDQNYYGSEQGYYNANQSDYANAANAEGANIGNTPGFTTDEMGNILQTGAYTSGETTASQYAGLNPTDAQASAMAGNP